MSHQLIAHSPDLLRLRDEGYDLDILEGYLLVRDVPFVNAEIKINRGILVSKLELSGDTTNKPTDHVTYWVGEHPCHADGRKISAIENPSSPPSLGDGITANFTFSAKADYRDYYHKMTTYIGRIAGEAAKLDSTFTAQTFPVIMEDTTDGVFKYIDSASSRVNINSVNEKLAGQRIGIIGLGGTGSYILDLVAKTWVAQIHLFDNDIFYQHNAFRAPGAPTKERLQEKPKKVEYLSQIYSNMRNGIITHNEFLDESNISLLDNLDFVFLCLDQGSDKRLIVDYLVERGVSFVEVGMGLLMGNAQPTGIVRAVISTPENRELAAPHISYADGSKVENEYATNIQIAELNALNAALAVIQWKKHFGFYSDLTGQYYAGYSISSGEISSESTK